MRKEETLDVWEAMGQCDPKAERIESMKMKGKIALITGSTKHTGFGIAQNFLDQGATVVINGRQEKDTQEAADKLGKAQREYILTAAGDISKPEDVERMFSLISEKLGTLDILVNNAVHQGVGDYFLKTPVELWTRCLESTSEAYSCVPKRQHKSWL